MKTKTKITRKQWKRDYMHYKYVMEFSRLEFDDPDGKLWPAPPCFFKWKHGKL